MKKIIWLCAICLFLFLGSSSVRAGEKRVIRVGYQEGGEYMGKDSSGEYVGFALEYLQQIAKYTGWEYEIVDCVTWENAYDMLESGAIDLFPAIYKTADRERDIAFSESPICNIYKALFVRADDTRYSYEDFSAFSGMRVGIIRGSHDGRDFLNYCRENQLDMAVSFYDTTEQMTAALSDKTLDGVAISYLGRNATYRDVADFSPEPLYIGIAKEETKLKEELDNALDAIHLASPYYDAWLYDKYFSVSSHQKPVFTREEQDYIEQAGEITAVYDSTWIPISYTDEKSGEFAGIAADLFRLVSEESGLRFRFTAAENYSSALDTVKRHEADMLCSMTSDYLWGDDHLVLSTSYYITAPVMKITDISAVTFPELIALPVGSYLAEQIGRVHPDAQIEYFNSVSDCFQAVRDGRAGSTYANIYLTQHYMKDSRYEDFDAIAYAGYEEQIGIGISNTADQRLYSILNRCVQYIADETMEELILNNTRARPPVSLKEFVRQHPVAVLSSVSAFFLIVISLLAAILYIKTSNYRAIRKLTNEDVLTGIFNLNCFRTEAVKSLESAEDGSYAIVSTDISQFKAFNDNFGFAQGDRLLRFFATLLEDTVGDGECCARVSSDQFLLLLRYKDYPSLCGRLMNIDQKMNRRINALGRLYHLILRFGVYIYSRADGSDISLLIDFANYARRSAGAPYKSTVLLYDRDMRQSEMYRLHIENSMEGALKNRELVPYFQPKVSMVTGELLGSEALVRWITGDNRVIPPLSFIPYVEANGFVVEIDLFIYEEVCRYIRRWMDAGFAVTPVSCNFSRLHMKNPGFPERLAEIADNYRIPHEYLELEITESAVAGDSGQTLRQINRLKALGFQISVDDFGTGYSSLSLLEQIPADTLKLDQSFIRKNLEKRKRAVIRGIYSVAADLNMKVICEGVETKEQAEFLVDIGGDAAQGFYYAKPMPPEEFERNWLLNAGEEYEREQAEKQI